MTSDRYRDGLCFLDFVYPEACPQGRQTPQNNEGIDYNLDS